MRSWMFWVGLLAVAGVSAGEVPVMHLYTADAAEHALREAAAAFAEREGVRVEVHVMKAAAALTEIGRERRGDWFIPALGKNIDAAREQGLVAREEPTGAYLGLAIAVRRGNPKGVRGLDDLLRGDVTLGLGDPELSALGALSRRMLERAPRGREIAAAAKLRGSCCSTTAALLLQGGADAVIGWTSFSSWAPDRIEIVPLPDGLTDYFAVRAAVLSTSRDPERAGRFLDFLRGEEGRAIFRRNGMDTDPLPGRLESLPVSLPRPNAGIAAFWDGRHAYVIGGDLGDRFSDEILRFDPATARWEPMRARLPSPRKIPSVAWDGRRAYVFGGCTEPDTLSDEIVVFDPAEDRVWLAGARLPSPRGRTAAVWAEGAAWVLGGNVGGFAPTGYLDEIVKYDPTTDQVTPAGRLPSPRASRIAAGWDRRNVYLFGGMIEGGKSDEVVAFDPAIGTCRTVGRLPAGWDGGAVIFDGSEFLLFGGMTEKEWAVDTIWAWVPGIPRATTLAERLPEAVKGQAAVWTGDATYVFGGRTGPQALTARIVRRASRLGGP